MGVRWHVLARVCSSSALEVIWKCSESAAQWAEFVLTSSFPLSDRSIVTFESLGVPAALCRSLAARRIDAPFPIQEATVPPALAGRDVCGKAPTGSGKTLAFGLAIAVRLGAPVQRVGARRPRALVLVPTRELATQVAEELALLLGSPSEVAAVFGGTGYGPQRKALQRGVPVLVACPGRLEDLISSGDVILDAVEIAVLDEADRMADMGFLPAVRRILDLTADERQTLLFSATLDGDVDAVVRRYQDRPVRHEVPGDESDGTRVRTVFWSVERGDRVSVTADLVRAHGPTIVFSRTRHGADRLTRQLERAGVKGAALHGARSQSQRERALAAFTAGRVQALVATDVAARGIHVDDVACVVHFDLPEDPKDFVHRSGRTGRAGAEGLVVAMATPDRAKLAGELQRALGLPKGLDAPSVLARSTARPARANGAAARSNGTEAAARPDPVSSPGRSEESTQPRGAKARRSGGQPGSSRDDRGRRTERPHGQRSNRTRVTANRHSAAVGAGSDTRTGSDTRNGARTLPTGTVTFFDRRRGFGFIAADGGGDVFVHVSNVVGGEGTELQPGRQVSFEVGPGRRGDEARKVTVI
ncbi:MAG: DEAD/DEAH box helicase [Acidimicrobiia bacterium]|nr:DEAD/DEAH box helicase [Acidimicrobiia bacterium]